MTTSSSSQKHSVKTQQRKNENMKFLAGSKIWRENFKNIFLQKKKKIFEMKYFPEIFFSNFGTKQKLHVFVFFLLGIERKSFPEEKIFLPGERILRKKTRKSQDSKIIRLFLRQFIQILFMMAVERSKISSGFNL